MAQYYIVIDGQQSGPYSLDELISLPQYSHEAYVWCEGMADWAHAGEISELTALENAASEESMKGPQQPLEGQASSSADNYQQATSPAEPENECPEPRLGLAIFSAIMFPIGIAAIVKTALIRVRWNQGRYDDARWLAKTAHKYAVTSIVTGFIFLGLFITYYIFIIGFILSL